MPENLTSSKNSDSSEQIGALSVAISMLSKRFQDVILMKYIDEMSITEISVKLNISEGTVKSRLHNSRKKLEILLNKMNFFEN